MTSYKLPIVTFALGRTV